MKKCPFCAEEIQDEAIYCRHCESRLDLSLPSPRKNTICPDNTQVPSNQSNNAPLSVRFGYRFPALIIGLSALLAVIFVSIKYIPKLLEVKAPTSFRSTTLSTNEINLEWNYEPNDKIKFEIDRRPGTAGDFYKIASLEASERSYRDNDNLVSSTTYIYRIRAVKGTNFSIYSPEMIVTTQSNNLKETDFDGQWVNKSQTFMIKVDWKNPQPLLVLVTVGPIANPFNIKLVEVDDNSETIKFAFSPRPGKPWPPYYVDYRTRYGTMKKVWNNSHTDWKIRIEGAFNVITVSSSKPVVVVYELDKWSN